MSGISGKRTFDPARRLHEAKAGVPGLLVLGAWILGVSLGATRPAEGSTYWVDRSNASCSDAGSGTQEQPYCTISAALAAHHDPGTTIAVLPGIYREQVTMPASGVSGGPIAITAQAGSGGQVIVDGADDFANPSLWISYSGSVWRASSVSWSPKQVFADGARLTPSSATPAQLPAKSFVWVPGSGLYVNVGGDN